MVSDAYDIIDKEDGALEVDCAMIVVGATEVNTGANASAEEAEEALEDGAKQVNNVIESFRLQPTNFDKKSYTAYMKGYLKSIVAHLEATDKARVDGFKKDSAALFKKVIANFKDYEFYTGESQDVDGMIALLNYREDGITPYFTFFKDGLKAEKV
ncbi:hypothetical protein IWQ56_004565 [Coemansia nantahalensis]|nr:hypothetical protein IWQ56_004565 [Coemansia nantahalensis]